MTSMFVTETSTRSDTGGMDCWEAGFWAPAASAAPGVVFTVGDD
jgi:hypothetical protein